MNDHPHPIVPWWVTLVLAMCLLVLVLDTGDLPGIPELVWSHVYGAAGVLLLMWRLTLYRWALVGTTAVIYVASFSRAMVWLLFEWPDRAAGIAINVIVMMASIQFLTCQWRWSR